MDSALNYTHTGLEEGTSVNFFQDYCDINEIRIWPTLVEGRKEGRSWSSLSSCAACTDWDGVRCHATCFGAGSSRGSSKANLFDSNTAQRRYLHVRESGSETSTVTSTSC